MKRAAIGVLLALSVLPAAAHAQAVPEIPFDSAPNALKLPADLNFGEDAGVAVNSKGHVFVFTRSNSATGSAYGGAASQLLEFGPDGKFVREIGKGLYAWAFAHAVRVDKDDNIWCIDKGSDMIVKFNPEGHVVMVFGRKKEASDDTAEPWKRVNPPLAPIVGQFRQPTDVAWNAAGDIFISDGYINSRVAKFDKNGDWVKSFGEPGSGPGQLNTPHSIAIDARGNVYVANRGNVRIEVFDGDGKYLRQSPGAPWAVCITPGANQVLYAADAYPGRIYKLTLDGKMLGVLGKAGKQPKQFGWIHEIACPSENELYVAEILNWRVQKLTLRPDRSTR
jgi:streptogramin lyase